MTLMSPMSPVTALPEVRVEIDGRPIDRGDRQRLTDVLVRQQLSAPTVCELAFLNPDGQPNALATLGATLGISVDGKSLFTGEVTAVEHEYAGGALTLRVRAYDVLHRLRKRQQVRALTDVTAEGLASQLVGRDGLRVDADEDGPPWRRLIQWRQTDFELLASACDRCGLYFFVRDGALRLMTLKGQGNAITLSAGQNLLRVHIETNSDGVCGSVATSGWDPSRTELRRGAASEARVERTAPVDIAAGDMGSDGQRILLDQVVSSDQQAEALAQGELDRRAARGLTLWGIADGSVDLAPGTPVEIEGVAPDVAGAQVLTTVTHTISVRGGGYTCELSTVPPPSRPPRVGAQVVWGTVSGVDDPDGLGRVRVSLPAYENVETDWLSVAAVGAGSGKGMVWLPDCGDHVLILFSDLETAQGLVLGGLFGPGGAPGKGGVESGKVRGYSFTTPGGQRLRLNDSRRSVRLENHDGSFIEMTPDHVHLHAAADLTLEAPRQEDFDLRQRHRVSTEVSASMKILTAKANIRCDHLAPVKLEPLQTFVTIDGSPVLVKPDPEHKSIGSCPFRAVGIKPCTNTLDAKTGWSGFITIVIQNGPTPAPSPVCLDTLSGMTDGVPPIAKFSIHAGGGGSGPDAGQQWVDHR